MHHEDTTQALALAFGGVVHGVTGVDNTGVHAEVAQLAHEGVSHNLECQRRERSGIVSHALALLLGTGDDTLDGRDIGGGRHIVNDSVQHLLDTLVTVRRTANNGNNLIVDGGLTQGSLQFLDSRLLALKVLHHEVIVGFGDGLHHLGMVFLSQLLHILGNGLHAHILTLNIIVNVCFHVDEVDDAAEGHFLTDGQLDRDGVGMQSVAHHVEYAIEVSTGNVHLIDISHTRDMVLISLTPNGFRLGLNAALGTENRNGTVKHAERTLNFHREVYVSGGINDVDTVILPVAGGCGGGNGDTSLLLVCHPVHGSRTLVGLTYLMGLTGVEQDTLGGRGLTGIDVSHDTDITSTIKRIFSSHIYSLVFNHTIFRLPENQYL